MAAPTEAAGTAAPPPPPSAPAATGTTAPRPPPSAPAAAGTTAPLPPPTATAAAGTTTPLPPPPATAAAGTATPPPHPPPTAAAYTAAPPPPPPATAAAGTAAQPPTPAPETAAKVAHTPPPLPNVPAPKKRKLEDAGFHTSAYYKIRATTANLRPLFVQVYGASDFRNSDAAREILKEIQTVMELSKKMRLDLSAVSEPLKPSEKPLSGVVKDGPTEPIPSGEKNQVPQTGQTAISPNNANDGAPPKPDK